MFTAVGSWEGSMSSPATCALAKSTELAIQVYILNNFNCSCYLFTLFYFILFYFNLI